MTGLLRQAQWAEIAGLRYKQDCAMSVSEAGIDKRCLIAAVSSPSTAPASSTATTSASSTSVATTTKVTTLPTMAASPTTARLLALLLILDDVDYLIGDTEVFDLQNVSSCISKTCAM